DRLEAVSLEGLELVEHEWPLQTGETVVLKPGRMFCQPEEATLHGAPGDSQDPGRLSHRHAGEQQPQEWGVEMRLLLVPVGPERLPGKASPAEPAAEALHEMGPAARRVPAISAKEAEGGLKMGNASGVGATWRNKHSDLPCDAIAGGP